MEILEKYYYLGLVVLAIVILPLAIPPPPEPYTLKDLDDDTWCLKVDGTIDTKPCSGNIVINAGDTEESVVVSIGGKPQGKGRTFDEAVFDASMGGPNLRNAPDAAEGLFFKLEGGLHEEENSEEEKSGRLNQTEQ